VIIGLNKFCEDAKVSVFVANIQILGLLRFISKKRACKINLQALYMFLIKDMLIELLNA
jgi:hypothetical protein